MKKKELEEILKIIGGHLYLYKLEDGMELFDISLWKNDEGFQKVKEWYEKEKPQKLTKDIGVVMGVKQ